MSASAPVTVGVDIGTTAVKAVAVDGEGTVLARARVAHRVLSPTAGASEHDVDGVWRDGVLAALGEVAAGREVTAVEVAAMVPSLGAVDRSSGRAVGPGLLYGDHRGERDGVDVEAAGDSGELLAFMRWLGSACPEATGFWPAQAVANHALTGRGAIDTTTAMTAHPLFDMVGWDADLAVSCGVDVAALPDIVPGFEPIGRVRGDLPAEGALVGGGAIDAMGEQMVAGADEPGDVLVICGGTLITWGVVDAWAEVPGLWTIPHTAAGLVLVGGPSNAGGLFQDAAARWTGVDSAEPPSSGTAPLAGIDPGDLPVWLPYVRGERTPLHRRDLRAELHDLGLHHRAGALRRAAHEAAGFVVRHHLDLAAATGLRPRRIVATGGGVRSAAWMQALADATGLPVDVVAVPEGAALGAAFMARCVAGLEPSMADASRWARTARTVEPDPAWVEPCTERYLRFRDLTVRAVEQATDRAWSRSSSGSGSG